MGPDTTIFEVHCVGFRACWQRSQLRSANTLRKVALPSFGCSDGSVADVRQGGRATRAMWLESVPAVKPGQSRFRVTLRLNLESARSPTSHLISPGRPTRAL